MRKIMLALGASAMVLPAVVATTSDADAQRRYKYREWKGNDGRWRCRKPDGTTGLIIGGITGGLAGSLLDNGRSNTLGILAGAGIGAALGASIDRGEVRCR